MLNELYICFTPWKPLFSIGFVHFGVPDGSILAIYTSPYQVDKKKRVIHDVGLLNVLKRCVKYHTTRIANTLIHCFTTKK